MADRIDPLAYAYDIDSSLEKFMSLACDESLCHDFRTSGEEALPLLRHSCGVHATHVR